VLRIAEAVGPTSLGRAESSRFRPLTLAVFRLSRQAVTFCSRHLSPVRRPPRGIRRSVPFSPAFQSPRGGFAPLGRFVSRQRSWDSTLRSFTPAGQFRERLSPRRPTCRLPVASSSMILVEASAARTREKTTAADQDVSGSPSGHRPVRPAVLCLSSDSGLMLPWALPLSGIRTPVGAA